MEQFAGGTDTETMNKLARQALLPAFLTLGLLSIAGCATDATPGTDSPPPTAVVGQGTVIQVADGAAQLCLGAIAESYPPQCSGIELIGWDWATVDGQESAGDVTWGTFAVWGDWDGQRLAVTDSVMLALYDPIKIDDPFTEPANAGSSSETELAAIEASVPSEAPVEVLGTWIDNGYVFAQVVFDDGSIQEWADTQFGVDVVQIRSALRTY